MRPNALGSMTLIECQSAQSLIGGPQQETSIQRRNRTFDQDTTDTASFDASSSRFTTISRRTPFSKGIYGWGSSKSSRIASLSVLARPLPALGLECSPQPF